MRARFGINGPIYQVDEGATIIDNKNETLDSAIIRISNLSSPLEIEPFDFVILDDMQLDDRYLLVDTFTETITCLSPMIYSYEIRLFSETKDLENYLCPNLKITKVWGQTRTVFDYFEQYLEEYGPEIRVHDGNSYEWEEKYTWSDRLEQRFSQIECPEMQWNKPTLREVLNDLLMVDDCIVVIKRTNSGKQPYIDFLDLTEENEITDLSHINYITGSQSSEDYVSELKVDLVNVTNPVNDKINNVVTRTEWCHITSGEDLITSDNWYVETQYPIYKIKSLKMFIYYPRYRAWIDAGGGQTEDVIDRRGWIAFDLTDCALSDHIDVQAYGRDFIDHINLVYEYKEWQTKKTKYTLSTGLSYIPVIDYPDYRNFTVYYVRGDNKIQNLSSIAEKYPLGNTYQLYTALKSRLINGYLLKNYYSADYYSYDIIDEHYELCFFSIEYETLENAVFSASKSEYPKHTRMIVDNQTNSYTDSELQGFLEYQKANRLGNLQKMINARYEDHYNRILQISDKYNDYVIYQCQYQVYSNHIEVNATATKHYVLRDYFTGVKAKIRSWRIADGSEALTRHDLNKLYLELSYERHSNENEMTLYNTDANLPAYFLTPLQSELVRPLKYVAFKTSSGSADYPTSPEYYALDLISRIVGNSVVFTFGLKDNYWVDTAFDNEEITYDNTSLITSVKKIAGGYPVEHYRYADDNGENDGIYYCLTYDMKNNNQYNEIESDSNQNLYANTDLNIHFVINSLYKPKVNIFAFQDYHIKQFTLNLKKDSQEITFISTQFEVCSETTDISFTKLFIERQQCMKNVADESFSITIVRDDESNYNFKNPVPEDPETISNITLAVFQGTAYRTYFDIRYTEGFDTAELAKINLKGVVNKKTLYILVNNEVIMALNNSIDYVDSEYHSDDDKYYGIIRVYMHLLKDRNKAIYVSKNNQTFYKDI